MSALLELNSVEVLYDDVILVLRGLSLEVREGQIVALLGSNGAGKTTTLKAISGLLQVEDGEVTDGSIRFGGREIRGLTPDRIVRRGIFQVVEGRRVFEHLTVHENLLAGAHTRRGCTVTFPNSPSGGASRRDTCPEASSRCWRWAGR